MRGAPEELADVARAVDKALGYPAPGVHVGGGRHVPMPEAWDGEGEVPLGWTRTAARVEPLEDGTAELVLDEAAVRRLDAPEARARLSRAEADLLEATATARP